ncbi:thioredoxin family protein [Paraflavitalea soli]|uniref:Thioredoxin family protein n=1 Tax=Paraflavitalea soli TaxID=2315862 RepID=A0A3B7MPJ9_9BACT|nr:thioredoxin family protein [Paraflavitalea soli]AXY74916.1 thioredoxin family protein [Paraflavitalea soli]
MKKLAASLLLPVIALLAFSVYNDPLPIGAPLPKAENKLKDISGKEITLKSAAKENGLLVMFSCNTCPVVINNQSRTNEICKYAQDKNVGVVLLNSNEGNRNSSESVEAMKSYAEGQGFQWYYAEDKNNELADAFGATRTPECFLFDKTGKLVYHGAIDDNPNDADAVSRKHLKEAINEASAGKEVSVKQSRSVGCAIKRLRS